MPENSTPQSSSDTRHIAQIPELSKIEKIVFMQLMHYLEANQILDSRQARYRTELLAVSEDSREALSSDMITLLVLFDISEAFDTIPYKKITDVHFSDARTAHHDGFLHIFTDCFIRLQ